MNSKELLIKIRSLFDSRGTTEATKQLDATTKAAETTGKSTTSSLQKAAGAASQLSSSVGGAGGAFRALGGAASSIAAGPIGILMAAVTLLTVAFRRFQAEAVAAKARVLDWTKAIGEADRRAVSLSNISLDKTIAEYARLRTEADFVGEAYSRIATAQNRLADAEKARTLARLALQESEEISKLKPGDDSQTGSIRARYAGLRSTVEGDAAKARATAEAEAARLELKAAQTTVRRLRAEAAAEEKAAQTARANLDRTKARIEKQLASTPSEDLVSKKGDDWYGRGQANLSGKAAITIFTPSELAAALAKEIADAQAQYDERRSRADAAAIAAATAANRVTPLNLGAQAATIGTETATINAEKSALDARLAVQAAAAELTAKRERERIQADIAAAEAQRAAIATEAAAKRATASEASQNRASAESSPGSYHWAGTSAQLTAAQRAEEKAAADLATYLRTSAERNAALSRQIQTLTASMRQIQ